MYNCVPRTYKHGYICIYCREPLEFEEQRECSSLKHNKLELIANFTKALTTFVLKDKGSFLPMKKIEERFAICEQCPLFNGNKCKSCGCGIKGETSLLNKLAFPSEKCPEGKW